MFTKNVKNCYCRLNCPTSMNYRFNMTRNKAKNEHTYTCTKDDKHTKYRFDQQVGRPYDNKRHKIQLCKCLTS